MASWLVRSSPDRAVRIEGSGFGPGSSPGSQGPGVVFLGKTLNCHCAPLSTLVYGWFAVSRNQI